MIGPSLSASMPLAEEDEEGTEYPYGLESEVVMIDFHSRVLSFLQEVQGDAAPDVVFAPENPKLFPSSQVLLERSLEWVTGSSGGDRMLFYSAAEDAPERMSTPKATPQRTRTKEPRQAQKPTTASLAAQLSVISETLPAISSQLEELQSKQAKFERALEVVATPSVPPHKQPFATGPSPTQAELASFVSRLPAAPKVKATPATPLVKHLAEDEPAILLSEEGYQQIVRSSAPSLDVSQAVYQQGQALTALVAHLVGQESMTDLSSSSSSGLSTKGSIKREKMQADLAARSGNFFLQVAQNAHRRLRPAEAVPTALDAFSQRSLFSKYVERQGSFSGQKDLGLVMFLLAQIADQMLSGDVAGARELLALSMVAVEQSAQDGGKWDLAWVLSLQEDPPAAMFHSKQAQTNPRLRAFAPLCPASWTTTALAYIKELDLITNRRIELQQTQSFKKGQQQEHFGDAAGDEAKKRPRFPRKPRGKQEG